MSFQIQPTPVARLNRCQLFGPGSRPQIFEKMANSTADVINLDLEDSVSPGDKEKARLNVIQAINDICLLYTSPSPRDRTRSRMPSSA